MARVARDSIDVSEIVRFIVAGSANTLFTLAIYEGLLFVVPYGSAYAVSWICGLLFAAIVYPNRVFRTPDTPILTRIGAPAVVSLMVFFVGTAMLHLLQKVDIDPRVGIFVVLPITASLGYGLLRALFYRRPH
jgi:putative flippase GtrA